MNCPRDGSILQMSERMGVEIDYCPSCRGVWLDRGELDKMLERAEREFQPQQAAPAMQQGWSPPPQQDPYRHHPSPDEHYRHRPSPDDHRYQQGHRRKSWLGEIFDFD